MVTCKEKILEKTDSNLGIKDSELLNQKENGETNVSTAEVGS